MRTCAPYGLPGGCRKERRMWTASPHPAIRPACPPHFPETAPCISKYRSPHVGRRPGWQSSVGSQCESHQHRLQNTWNNLGKTEPVRCPLDLVSSCMVLVSHAKSVADRHLGPYSLRVQSWVRFFRMHIQSLYMMGVSPIGRSSNSVLAPSLGISAIRVCRNGGGHCPSFSTML